MHKFKEGEKVIMIKKTLGAATLSYVIQDFGSNIGYISSYDSNNGCTVVPYIGSNNHCIFHQNDLKQYYQTTKSLNKICRICQS